MATYQVTWTIDVDAETAYDAAVLAESVQLRQATQDNAMRGVFTVYDTETNQSTNVDLADDDDDDEND